MRNARLRLKAQTAKLTAPEPELPKTGRTRTAKAALDQGHDRSPVTCTIGPDRKCKAKLPAEDLKTYQVARDPSSASQRGCVAVAENYSMDIPVKKITGAVIQKSSEG